MSASMRIVTLCLVTCQGAVEGLDISILRMKDKD